MRITLNGEERDIDGTPTVAELLERLRGDGRLGAAGIPAGACAVEVNRTLVPRRLHAERLLAEGDAVEIVTLVGGG